MGSLSAGKAGVGSAVNDTTRELGGTLGVAIIGSVFSSLYVNALEDSDSVVQQLPPDVQELTKESVGAARTIAGQLGANAQPYLDQVNDAFLSGLSAGALVAAAVAVAGAIFASRFLPAHAPRDGACRAGAPAQSARSVGDAGAPADHDGNELGGPGVGTFDRQGDEAVVDRSRRRGRRRRAAPSTVHRRHQGWVPGHARPRSRHAGPRPPVPQREVAGSHHAAAAGHADADGGRIVDPHQWIVGHLADVELGHAEHGHQLLGVAGSPTSRSAAVGRPRRPALVAGGAAPPATGRSGAWRRVSTSSTNTTRTPWPRQTPGHGAGRAPSAGLG